MGLRDHIFGRDPGHDADAAAAGPADGAIQAVEASAPDPAADPPAEDLTIIRPPEGVEHNEGDPAGADQATVIQPAGADPEATIEPAPQGDPLGAPAAPDEAAHGAAPTPAGPRRPGFRERGRLRRRLRFLREVRELGLRDLGGLVFDQHRFQRPDEQLVLGKVTAIDAVDRELRAIEDGLQERRPYEELYIAGISACPRCGALHGSDAHFCPQCGLAFGGPRSLGVDGAGASGTPDAGAPPGQAALFDPPVASPPGADPPPAA